MPFREMSREQMWMPPPTLDELLPPDHRARFVAEFVAALDREGWAEFGVEMGWEPPGAPAYHPRALLCVWLYGFMTGVRSCRKLETACRDRIPYLWLTGWQHPDHNTLWRFYRKHRSDMRKLFERTVRTAVTMGLLDLAVQAVDGTKMVANASKDRVYDAAELRALLGRLDKTISELEAQNEAGEDEPAVNLPEELADKKVLKEQVRQAMDDLAGRGRQKCINLTDRDARLMKSSQGIVTGYNAQAMVSPLQPSVGASGMFVTAADVVDEPNDSAQLVPMLEQSEETTGARAQVTLADAGYHSGSALDECARRDRKLVMPESSRRRAQHHPYHKDRFIYDQCNDSYLCPHGQTLTPVGSIRSPNGTPRRVYRASAATCQACPAFGVCTNDLIEWTSAEGRVSRRSLAPPSHLDVHPRGTAVIQTQEAADRTGLRHHQGATGGASILAARPRQCSSRVDLVGDRVQPEDPLAHMALRRCWLPALQPGIPTHSLSVAPGSVNTASSTVGMTQLM